jgi:hypothetical protein
MKMSSGALLVVQRDPKRLAIEKEEYRWCCYYSLVQTNKLRRARVLFKRPMNCLGAPKSYYCEVTLEAKIS